MYQITLALTLAPLNHLTSYFEIRITQYFQDNTIFRHTLKTLA